MKAETRQLFLSGLIILAVIAISVLMIIFQEKVKALEGWGYIGLFLVGFFASAAMFAPVPGLVVLAASARVLNPFLAGMVFAVAASLGELSGYLVGSSGRGIVNRTKWHTRVEGWMRKYGGFTIVILGFIPNVLIDVAGLVAGALKMPWYHFLFFVFLGKVPKSLLITYGVGWFMQLFGVT